MGEHSLGDALKKFLSQSRLKGSIQALQIEEVWEHLEKLGITEQDITDAIAWARESK